jgi:hypothetical protein
MKQTAVEWLEEQLSYDNGLGVRYPSHNEMAHLNDYFKQAKEMEKQQIIDADLNGSIRTAKGNDLKTSSLRIKELGEQYYNQTFGKSTPWYDEDQTTERMNVIGQNGNDGEHY